MYVSVFFCFRILITKQMQFCESVPVGGSILVWRLCSSFSWVFTEMGMDRGGWKGGEWDRGGRLGRGGKG